MKPKTERRCMTMSELAQRAMDDFNYAVEWLDGIEKHEEATPLIVGHELTDEEVFDLMSISDALNHVRMWLASREIYYRRRMEWAANKEAKAAKAKETNDENA